MKRIIFLFSLFLLFLFSCRNENDENKGELAKTYIDLLIAEQKYTDNPDSLSLRKSEIFEKSNLTEDEYLAELEKFSSDREEWEKFFASAQTYLDSLKESDKPE